MLWVITIFICMDVILFFYIYLCVVNIVSAFWITAKLMLLKSWLETKLSLNLQWGSKLIHDWKIVLPLQNKGRIFSLTSEQFSKKTHSIGSNNYKKLLLMIFDLRSHTLTIHESICWFCHSVLPVSALLPSFAAVSYTHLTLPTIYSV